MAIVSENKNLSENGKKILEYLVQNDGNDFTAADIATAIGIGARSVNGTLTGSFQNNSNDEGEKIPLIRREDAVVSIDGKPTPVKFVRLTDAGKEYAATVLGW